MGTDSIPPQAAEKSNYSADTPSSLKGGTLFSGIGAPEIAAPWIDWRWCAEIEPFAAAVHKTRFQGVPNLGDVTKIDFRTVEPVDLIVFGSPCQSFSVAGKRAGLDDPRGNLALVALRLVAALRPRWFLFENVPGLLSSEGGRDFGIFVGAVEQCGYGWAYRTLDAQHFGVPQRRRRVFVVGPLGGWAAAATVLFEPASLQRHPAPGRETGEGVAGTLSESLGRNRGLGNENECDALVANPLGAKGDGGWRGDLDNDTFVFDPTARQPEWSLNKPLKTDGPLAVVFTLTKRDQHAVAFAQNQRGELRTAEIAAQLTTGGGKPGEGYPAVAFNPNKVTSPYDRTRFAADLPSYPLQSTERTPHVASAMSVRRLTPRECERLQGFPDDFTLIAWRGKPAADGPRYRALGNSMAVPVVRWILGRIEIAAKSEERTSDE